MPTPASSMPKRAADSVDPSYSRKHEWAEEQKKKNPNYLQDKAKASAERRAAQRAEKEAANEAAANLGALSGAGVSPRRRGQAMPLPPSTQPQQPVPAGQPGRQPLRPHVPAEGQPVPLYWLAAFGPRRPVLRFDLQPPPTD